MSAEQGHCSSFLILLLYKTQKLKIGGTAMQQEQQMMDALVKAEAGPGLTLMKMPKPEPGVHIGLRTANIRIFFNSATLCCNNYNTFSLYLQYSNS